jgi:hypothetical protein
MELIKSGIENNSKDILKFEFPVEIVKARKENGKHYVDFVASDTDIDLHYERFTENAIKEMVEYSKEGVDLLKTHYEPFGMGITVDGEIRLSGTDTVSDMEIYEFKGTALLDMEYRESQILFEEVKNGTNVRQLSVGGHIKWDEEDAVIWEEREIKISDSRSVCIYILALNKFKLDHIAVTRHNGAANPRTGFISAIFRSIDHEWMKRKGIQPSYKHIDDAINDRMKYSYNLGWLIPEITTSKGIAEKENDDMTAEEIRERVAKESQERMKGVSNTAQGVEVEEQESSDTSTDKKETPVIKTENQETENQETQFDGKKVMEMFKQLNTKLENITKKSGEPEQEETPVIKTENQETADEAETEETKPTEIDSSKEEISALKSQFSEILEILPTVQKTMEQFLELSNNQIKSFADSKKSMEDKISAISSRLNELEISGSKVKGLEDSTLKTEDSEDNGCYIFGRFNK